MKTLPKYVAIHEASHAVVECVRAREFALDCMVSRIIIYDKHVRLRGAVEKTAEKVFVADHLIGPVLFTNAVISLAGTYGEAKFRKMAASNIFFWGGSDGDIDSAHAMLRQMIDDGLTGETYEELLLRCERQTRHIINDADIWRAILALGKAIHRHRVVEAPAMHDIINPILGSRWANCLLTTEHIRPPSNREGSIS